MASSNPKPAKKDEDAEMEDSGEGSDDEPLGIIIIELSCTVKSFKFRLAKNKSHMDVLPPFFNISMREGAFCGVQGQSILLK